MSVNGFVSCWAKTLSLRHETNRQSSIRQPSIRQHPDGLARVCPGCLGLLFNGRTDSLVLGLPGVHSQWLQTGSGPPARRPFLHACSQRCVAVCQRPHTGGADGEPAQCLAFCSHHHATVLDHHPSSGPPERGGAGHAHPVDQPPGGSRWSLHLLLQRHLLVFGSRGRGICLLVVPHGTGVLADAEVGRACRRAPQRPLSGAHCLHHRPFHRRPSA